MNYLPESASPLTAWFGRGEIFMRLVPTQKGAWAATWSSWETCRPQIQEIVTQTALLSCAIRFSVSATVMSHVRET